MPRPIKKLLEHDAATKMDFLQAEAAADRQDPRICRAAQEAASRSVRACRRRRATTGRIVSEFQQTKQAELSALETKASRSRRMSRKPDRRRIFSD